MYLKSVVLNIDQDFKALVFVICHKLSRRRNDIIWYKKSNCSTDSFVVC